jgi:exopolysaccharide biosynthesis polyprenyl glycosylphosphotransferase
MRSWRPDEGGAGIAKASVDGQAVVPPLRVVPPVDDTPAPQRRRGRFNRGRVRVLAAADLLAIAIAFVGTYALAEIIGPPAYIAPHGVMAGLVVVATITWIAVFAAYRLYEGQTRSIAPNSMDEIGNLFHALLAGSLVLLVAGQGFKRLADWSVYSPLEALMFLGIALVAIPVLRGVVRTWVLPSMVRPRRTLIVGAGDVGRLVRRKLDSHPEYGLEFVGFIEDDPRIEDDVVGRTTELTYRVDELDVEWVILTATGDSYEETLDRVRAVRRPDVHLSIVPNYFELFASNASMEDIEGVPVVSLPPMRFSGPVRVLKRTFDVAAAGLGLLVLSPLLAVVALAVKLDSRGPVFFRQKRHGRGGTEFSIVKFRTMVDGAEQQRFDLAHLNEMEGGGPLFKIKEDPRITRVGATLRKLSLDELPQLWNVVRGEMSLVGPRPFVVHESERITGWAGRRLETTPGITGLWQVLGRNDIPFEEMVKLDYVYVTNWSLWWDIKILFQTIPVVLARKGAY